MPYKDKNKQREFGRLWIAKRRHDYFKDKACVSCGILEKLELDHIDPKTKVSHAIWSWREERRLEEIKKCQVLCHWCHKKKTSCSKTLPVVHGMSRTYANGCRCRDCVDYNTAKSKERRLRLNARKV